MSVLEAPTEEEAYLWCLISDPSGLDLAEFCWIDHEQESGCWRAWAYQWKWFRDTSPLQIDQCGRSVGKSLSIKLRAFCFPFLHPGQEMVITAPELNHLQPIVGLVEHQFHDVRLGREMLPKGRGNGTTHRPFQMDFLNGSRIIGRIPQRDGKGVKGIHPIWLELDEAQDYPAPGWVEVIETLKRGHDGAMWRAHGVTKGVRDYFYKFTQPESGWKVHRTSAMARPTWTDAERQEKIEAYGSKDHPDYRRNVLGLHGDATNPLFVLHRLLLCIAGEHRGGKGKFVNDSDYNENVYQNFRVNLESLIDAGGDIATVLDFNTKHKQMGFKSFWAGMDVGYTNHPSEILVFGESVTKGDLPHLTLLSRVHLERISHGSQVEAIAHVIKFYGCEGFSMDKTGLGLPLYQDLQGTYPKYANIIKGYNFSSKILVEIDQSIEIDEFRETAIEKAGIYRNVLEYASDKLREYVDAARITLPWDKELIGEFQGQTYYVVRDTMNQYGKKSYSAGSFHALDAARMAVLGYAQKEMESMEKAAADPNPDPVLDFFIEL